MIRAGGDLCEASRRRCRCLTARHRKPGRGVRTGRLVRHARRLLRLSGRWREVAIVHEARLRHDTRLGRLVPCRQPKPTVTALLRRLTLEPGGLLLLLLQLLASLLLKAQLVLPHQPVLVGERLQHGLLLGGQIVLVLQELQLQHLLLVKVEWWHRLAGHRSDHTTTGWSAAGSAILLLEALVRQTIVAAHLLLLRLLSGMVLGTLGRGRKNVVTMWSKRCREFEVRSMWKIFCSHWYYQSSTVWV